MENEILNNEVFKKLKKNSAMLSGSKKTFEDIYNILFLRDRIVSESFIDGEIVRHTTDDIKADIERLAAGISSNIKCRDEYIAVDCSNRIEWIIIFWGIMMSGNKPYLVNPNLPCSVIEDNLKTLGIENVIMLDSCDKYNQKLWTFKTLMTENEVENFDCNFADSIALSSIGTTSTHKICIFTGKEIAAQLLNSEELALRNPLFVSTYNNVQKVIAVLPYYHIYGLLTEFLWAMFWSMTIVFPSKIDSLTITETVRRHEVTHVFSVPILWNGIEKKIEAMLVQSGSTEIKEQFYKAIDASLLLQNKSIEEGLNFAKAVFKDIRSILFGDSVKFCISGGSDLPENTMKVVNGIGYPLFNGYGMTEIGVPSVDFDRDIMDRLEPSIGRPLPSAEFKISDTGTLLVKGSSMCRQIIINGEVIDHDEWFDTKDIAECRNGKYYLMGRDSDVVLGENGENINPYIAEKSITIQDAVDFCIISNEHHNALNIIIQTLPNADKKAIYNDTLSQIKTLPKVYRFSYIYFTESPLTTKNNIKISRSSLRKRMLNDEFEGMEVK